MNFSLKLGCALLIFIASLSNAFALVLTVTADGSGSDSGFIQVYNSSSTLVGTCTLPAGCDPALATLPADVYAIVAIPPSLEVSSGFSACTGGVVMGNRCTINLTVDTTVTATFDPRLTYKVYDQDADGIDDLTEAAFDKNPLLADGAGANGVYLDSDTDGLPDFIETNLTHTIVGNNDGLICNGTPPTGDDLTGQWDLRIIDTATIAAGHTITDPVTSKRETLTALSICHTDSGLQVFHPNDGYATGVTFIGNVLSATFTNVGTLNATFTSLAGLFGKGRLEDLNFNLDGSQIRADRRMLKTELSSLSAVNLSGVLGIQVTEQNAGQAIDKPYNPGTYGLEIAATGTGVLPVDMNDASGSVVRGYFVPSVGSFFAASRTPEQTGIDLDADTFTDDQTLSNQTTSLTFVQSPTNGVGGMFRGEHISEQLADFNSDFIVDNSIKTTLSEIYGKGVPAYISTHTVNFENTIGGSDIKSRISIYNPAHLSDEIETVTVTGVNITGSYVLINNIDSLENNNTSNVLTTRNLVTGYSDGEKIGVHLTDDYNGLTLTTKAENALAAGSLFANGTYTISYTVPALSTPINDIDVSFTDHSASPLPFATNIRLDNRTLKISAPGSRLVNSDSSHTLSWDEVGASTLSGSTGVDLYKVRIRKTLTANDQQGILDGVQRLEILATNSDCVASTCSVNIPKDAFDPDFTYTIQVQAFDNINHNNRSMTTNRYVSAASLITGCNNNTDNEGRITNGSPCAEYFQVNSPRIYDVTGTETPTLLDYAVNKPVGTPKAIVVLFSGGIGHAGIIGDVGTKTTQQTGLNSLIRSAQMFADAGYLTISIDRPTDEKYPSGTASYIFDAYRISPRSAHDIALVLNEVNQENLNVFLVGTSRGAISAVNQAALGTGISITVPVNSNASGYVVVAGSHPVGQISDGEKAPASITVPVHYLTNPDETCNVTQPTIIGDTTIFDSFIGLDTGIYGSIATTNQFASLSTIGNGIIPMGSSCKSLHYHGFTGSELAAANSTTTWLDGILATIDANNVTRTRPTRRLALPLVATVIDTSTLYALDPDGDAITYELSHATSSRGGSVTLVGTTLTYTPATAANTTDGFVVVAVDGNGGRTSMLITMDVSDDADADGLPDSIYPADGSDADALADTDSDTLTLLQEYQAGTDPTLSDPDGDGMDDAYELANLLDPNSATGNGGASADPDGDGFTNLEESVAGSLAIVNSSSPGLFNFSSATYSVNEDAGTLSALVTRSGSVGAVSVLCFSTDIATQATAGTDYTSVSTTLNWADGDATAKTCSVPITPDSDVEGNETFQLDLSNPTGGAKLGAP